MYLQRKALCLFHALLLSGIKQPKGNADIINDIKANEL